MFDVFRCGREARIVGGHFSLHSPQRTGRAPRLSLDQLLVQPHHRFALKDGEQLAWRATDARPSRLVPCKLRHNGECPLLHFTLNCWNSTLYEAKQTILKIDVS